MKKILLSFALLGTFAAKAQTIDTTSVEGVAVAHIQTPFTVKWNDTTKAHYLSVKSISDNLKDAATFTYTLYSAEGRNLDNGVILCNNGDYEGWSGNNKFPFSFVATKLGIAIK